MMGLNRNSDRLIKKQCRCLKGFYNNTLLFVPFLDYLIHACPDHLSTFSSNYIFLTKYMPSGIFLES